jgi:phytoene dehydrogenase-like protein
MLATASSSPAKVVSTEVAATQVIVIGAGLSALLLALRLAKKQIPVTVIEKNASFGGFNGRLDNATPLVCYSALGLEESGSVAKLLSDSALWRNTPPRRMAISDFVQFPGLQLALPGEIEAFHAYLLARYPSQKNGLATLHAGMTEVHAAIRASAGRQGPLARAQAMTVLRRFSKVRYFEFLNAHIDDPELRKVLAIRAFSANNSALTMLAYLAKILIDGLYALPGCGAAISDELVSQLQHLPSCTLIAGVAVEEILFDAEQKSHGVRLQDGRKLSGSVISSIDPSHAQALVRTPEIQKALQQSLLPHPVSLSALNVIVTPSAELGRALNKYAHHARFFLSDDVDPFEVLAAREAGALDLRNCKVNIEFNAQEHAVRVYAEFDCALSAADFAGMAGNETQALAVVIASVRKRLRVLDRRFESHVIHVEVLTPHRFALLTNNRGGAASGFADEIQGMRALDGVMEKYGITQIGQWSMYGSGLSQLETSALQAYSTLRRRQELTTLPQARQNQASVQQQASA